MTWFLSNSDIFKLLKFANDVVSRGQNGQNYWSQDSRTREKQIIDNFRGKALELITCRMLDKLGILHSNIDWEVGKGSFGSTRDSGFDITINGYKVSVNATGPYDKWLLIPVYKFEQHREHEVQFLSLGTIAKKIEEINSIEINGFISFYDFDSKKRLFPKGGEWNLSVDNYGILKTELQKDWDIFRRKSFYQATF